MGSQASSSRFVFVDIERRRNRIQQIAAIAVDDELTPLETVDIRIRQRSKDASVHPKLAARRFANFLSRHATLEILGSSSMPRSYARLVAHNAERFDGPILHDWYRQQGVYLPAARLSVCTKQRALSFFMENPHLPLPTNYRLLTLCRYFGVELSTKQKGDALVDVRATLLLYRAMSGVSLAHDSQVA